ncbi:YrbL family protein [Rhizobium halophilum]|uniref:YrbL family protein n=1 Tax=Rhizobium halophilum TaxID=2846852 RepID=UPI001EFC6AFE|nr:YrbL family protein [Rhizobium halophilum]MCF6370538.1 PhoP regulatory network YrbL family protein [Rhizobium halophilum]
MEEPRKVVTPPTDWRHDALSLHSGKVRDEKPLDLSTLIHQDAGTVRLVYVHPDLPDAVIKVVRPERVDGFGHFKDDKRLRFRRPLGMYRLFRRELHQYLELCRRGYGDRRSVFPMATPFGFLPTSEGLGLVTEKIKNESGAMGPSLKSLIRSGKVRAMHVAALNTLFDECIDLHLIIGDPNPGNMVYTEERSGRPEFVLVDGVGEKNLIPLRTLSWRYNRYKLKKAQRTLLAAIARANPGLPIAQPALA